MRPARYRVSADHSARFKSGGVASPAKPFQGFIEPHRRLILRAKAPDRNGAFDGFLLAKDPKDRHLGERMLAHLIGDFFVAKIALDTKPALARRRDHLVSIIVGLLGDRRDDDLQRATAITGRCPAKCSIRMPVKRSSEPNTARWIITGVVFSLSCPM